jgi:DNA-binding LacI/PurR family transcriptional regulator
MIPSRKDILRIAAEASVDPRTVRSTYDGSKPTRELTLARITEAAKKLKLPAPPATKGGRDV